MEDDRKAEKRLAELIESSPRGTSTRLAEYLGVHKMSVSKWAKQYDRYRIPKEHLPKIAEFFKVPIEHFFYDDMKQVRLVPKIGKASCGVPTEYVYEASEYVPYATRGTKNEYAIDAEGDSMSPTIKDGDEVLCELDADIQNGDIVHFTYNGESGIKRYREDESGVYLIPDNPAYPPKFIPKSEINEDNRLFTAKCTRVTSKLS